MMIWFNSIDDGKDGLALEMGWGMYRRLRRAKVVGRGECRNNAGRRISWETTYLESDFCRRSQQLRGQLTFGWGGIRGWITVSRHRGNKPGWETVLSVDGSGQRLGGVNVLMADN